MLYLSGMNNSKYTHDIENINLIDGLLTLLVHESDIDKSADVIVCFEWDWDRKQTEKNPTLIQIQSVEFHEEQGDNTAVTKYIKELVDELWLYSVINGIDEPIKYEYISNL